MGTGVGGRLVGVEVGNGEGVSVGSEAGVGVGEVGCVQDTNV